MESKKTNIEEVRKQLSALRKGMEAKYYEVTKHGIENNKASEVITPKDVRAIIDEAYNAIEEQMPESISWPRETNIRKIRLSEWSECTRLLQVMNRLNKSTN